jgi:hypothetical protein
MRRFAGLLTCVTLPLAFLLAPFQHVHAGHSSGADHDHSGVVHAHFYSVAPVRGNQHGPAIDDVDDDHAAVRSLDTFTLVLTAGVAPFVLTRGVVLPFIPAMTFEPVELVEQRGHDPPCVDRSIPRAPPSELSPKD